MKTVPQVTAQQAQAAVNQLLTDRLPDRFTFKENEIYLVQRLILLGQ